MILKTLKLLLELGEKSCVQDPFLILRVLKFLLQIIGPLFLVHCLECE